MARVPTIFVADDDTALVAGLELALTLRGYAVRTASSGRGLLELLDSERPDLLLVDVVMPEVDGLEVVRRVRAREELRGVPVLVVTALLGGEDRARVLGSGASEYIPKPFSLGELLARIEAHLAERGDLVGG